MLTFKTQVKVKDHLIPRTHYQVHTEPKTGERRFYVEDRVLLPEKVEVEWQGRRYKAERGHDGEKTFYSFSVTCDYDPTPTVAMENDLIDLIKEVGGVEAWL